MADIIYSSWDAASYSWGTGKTRCRLVYSVSSSNTETTITIGSDSELSAVQCHSTYNMSLYGVKVTSGHKGGGGKDAAYNYSTGVMDGSNNWKAKVAKRSYVFPRKSTSYNVTIYTSYEGQTVNGYGGMKNSGSVTKTITIPSAKTYTVKFDANGGTGAPSSQVKYHDTKLTLSSKTPTRAGYTFKGWATSKTATTATYKAGGSYTGNADITLYAVWESNYEKPTVSNITLVRCDKNGNASAIGNYVKVGFKWTADSKLNANNIVGLSSYTITCTQTHDDKKYSVSKTNGTNVAGASGIINDIVIGGTISLTEDEITTTKTLSPIKNCTIKVEITDGVNNKASSSNTINAESYSAPKISNIKASRANGDSTYNDEGTSGHIEFKWSINSLNNENKVDYITVGYRKKGDSDYINIPVDYDANSISGTAISNIIKAKTETFNGVVTDGMDKYERSIITIVEKPSTDDGGIEGDVGDIEDGNTDTEEVLVKIPYYKFSDSVLITGNLIGGEYKINSTTSVKITADDIDESINGVAVVMRNGAPIMYVVEDGTLLGITKPGIYMLKTDEEYISSITYADNLLSIEDDYQVRIIVADKLSSTTQTVTISRTFFTMDFKAGGKGVAFGKVSNKDGFECDMQATFNNGLIENIPVKVKVNCYSLTQTGKYYLGNDSINRPTERVNQSTYDRNGWLETKRYSDDYCHQTYTTYYGSSFVRTKIAGTWTNWIPTYTTNEKGRLLWKGYNTMGITKDKDGNETKLQISLSDSISNQQHGIILVFSHYDVDKNEVTNNNFHSFFISKGFVQEHTGYGSGFIMQRNHKFYYKHLFIYDTRIVGHSTNSTTEHNLHGQTVNQKTFVLREVWGV